MPDIAQIGLDGSQYFDVIARMQGSLDSLQGKLNNVGQRGGGAGEHIGESFLRSERRVSRSAANIATSMLSGQNAVEALAYSFLQAEHATKLGLGFAVGAAVAIAIFEVLAKQIDAVKKAEEELSRVSSKPLGLIGQLDPASIDKQIEAERSKLTALEKLTGDFAGNGDESQSSFGTRFKQGLADVAVHGIGGASVAEASRLTKIAEEQARIRKEGELRLVAETAIVAAQEIGLHVSSTEGELLKAKAVTAAKIAQLELDARDKPNPVVAQEIALEREKLKLTEELIQKKAFHAQGELIREEDIANFRGTSGERTDKTLQSNLTAALKERDVFAQNLQEKEQANLGIAKAQLAIYERQKEVRREISDLHFATKVDSIKASAAQAAVGVGSEEGQRINLQEQVRIADVLRLKAAQRATEEHLSAKSMQEFNAASATAVQAQANLAKFENERAFQSKQETNKAKGDNAVTVLQQSGQSFAANLLKIREATEQKIAGLLREQKGDLASQAAIAGQLQLREQAKQALKNPQAVAAQERAAQQEDSAFNAKIGSYLAALRRGVKFDESDPTANIIKAYLSNSKALGQEGDIKSKDYSSVASLAGQDFSGILKLADFNFEGLKTLSGLTITVM